MGPLHRWGNQGYRIFLQWAKCPFNKTINHSWAHVQHISCHTVIVKHHTYNCEKIAIVSLSHDAGNIFILATSYWHTQVRYVKLELNRALRRFRQMGTPGTPRVSSSNHSTQLKRHFRTSLHLYILPWTPKNTWHMSDTSGVHTYSNPDFYKIHRTYSWWFKNSPSV